MRALGYFISDREAEAGLRQDFDRFCVDGPHIRVGVYNDVKGSKESPNWDEMVRYIEESRRGYLVVVPSAAHLGLSMEEQIGRVLRLDKLTCQVVCNDEEYPDPVQNALKVLRGSGSRSEKIRKGMLAKAAQGLGLGKPPYGYRISVDGTFLLVEAEADVVVSMFDRYLSHDSGVRSIADWLNNSGRRTRRGQRWSMVTVRDILRNTSYIGTYRRFGLRIPAAYEAIVTPAVFRQVQERMQSRNHGRRHPTGEPFLLSGLLYCGHCGQRMMGVTRRQVWRRKDGERVRGQYRYYQCQSRINRSQCEYRTTKAAELEDVVLEQVKELHADGSPIASDEAAKLMTERRAQVDARIGSLRKRYLAFVERTANGGMSLDQLALVTEEMREMRRRLREQRQLLDGSSEGMQRLVDSSRRKLQNGWSEIDMSERQEVLRTLVSKVVAKDGQVEVVGR
jgi:site-specific DNA recombinase